MVALANGRTCIDLDLTRAFAYMSAYYVSLFFTLSSVSLYSFCLNIVSHVKTQLLHFAVGSFPKLRYFVPTYTNITALLPNGQSSSYS